MSKDGPRTPLQACQNPEPRYVAQVILRYLTFLDPVAHSIVLLGTTSDANQAQEAANDQAILILKKTSFSRDSVAQIAWEKLESLESNDIVSGIAWRLYLSHGHASIIFYSDGSTRADQTPMSNSISYAPLPRRIFAR